MVLPLVSSLGVKRMKALPLANACPGKTMAYQVLVSLLFLGSTFSLFSVIHIFVVSFFHFV